MCAANKKRGTPFQKKRKEALVALISKGKNDPRRDCSGGKGGILK